MIVIVMGVSGTGKTSIGQMLAKKLSIPFHDADDYHPENNIQKMGKGIPLQDKDRTPWLELLNTKLKSWNQLQGAVLACSALKESYRKLLAKEIPNVQWVFLDGPKSLIQERVNSRVNHFMKSQMLDSQFDSLEPPNYGFHVEIDNSKEAITNTIYQYLIDHA